MAHYASSTLIQEIYGVELYNYVFDLDNTGVDATRVEWALSRADERVDMRLMNSLYQVPLESADGNPLRFVPNWAAVFAFASAYQVRGRQIDNEAAEGKYSMELRRVNHEIKLVLTGGMRLNALTRDGASMTPLSTQL